MKIHLTEIQAGDIQNNIMGSFNFVLVRPQLGENIGMSARAMLNFGNAKLSIVSPRDGWPNFAASKSAANAEKVISNAKIFCSLKEAIKDSEFVFATSARKRELNLPVICLQELSEKIRYLNKKNISFLFGPESSGLSNEDLCCSNSIITIPVNHECPSINLAASVALVSYELSKYRSSAILELNNKLANRGDLQKFFDRIEVFLDETNFWKVKEKKSTMFRNLKNIFNRIPDLTKNELQTILGIFSKLSK